MAKVNEFETAEYKYSKSSKQRFTDSANDHYTYTSAEDILDNLPDLSKMIQHHQENQAPRLRELEKYYKGENTTILKENRRREEHLADNRAIHNFAKYVSQFIQGYMVGIPLKTTYPNEGTNEQLREINRINDADEHNSELILALSIYGRAYELLYRNQNDEFRFTDVSVQNTFVIYDTSVEKLAICAVRYIYDAITEKTTVYVYTADSIIQFDLGNDFKLTETKSESHAFGGVPIIEYENNKFRQGDFEDVLSLIDMYDSAQSDLANYSQDLNDAMLKIIGNLDLEVDDAKEMKKNNIIFLRTEPNSDGRESSADADYIYKEYDVQGSEAYKTRIANDIHLFTATPNLSDENFAGNMSGEVMKYKLFLMEQKRAAKERRFKRSLRDRYRLIQNVMSIAKEGTFDVSLLQIIFTENLPKDIANEMKWFTDAGGQLSQKTMISQLPFIENADEEIAQIEEEEKQRPINQPQYDFEEERSQRNRQGEEVNDNGE
ncbi:phage portal protein [Oceanobacillus oncorhynchi]|uniref:phage portal protein n=1 Tax=Oceanobacillus oncorhynchi TaxID=545501 RepID=UPI0025A4455D|nr:phage portal protein [Oceanobacillus oncorhynchi]MDM8100946.1 phage portal protein [Oceanobacillus oncorhynchi]